MLYQYSSLRDYIYSHHEFRPRNIFKYENYAKENGWDLEKEYHLSERIRGMETARTFLAAFQKSTETPKIAAKHEIAC